MAKLKPKIPVLDLPGLSSFQSMHGNPPELIMQGTRCTALFNPDDIFFALSERFNRNEQVNVLDFIRAQRELKAKMFSMRNQFNGQA